jgi:hypothetical protein
LIARLEDNILHKHGHHILLNPENNNVSNSWFTEVRSISNKYDLPDPLLVLQKPPGISYWKTLTKSRGMDWLHIKLRG